MFRASNSRPKLPRDLVDRLRKFARSEIDPFSPEARDDFAQPPYVPLYGIWQSDPDGCYEALRDAVLPAGGWALYGASIALWEIDSSLRHPPEIHLAALEFLRSRNVPTTMVRPWQWELWREHHPDTPWFSRPFTPPADDTAITPLPIGTMRPVARMTGQPEANLLLIQALEDGRFAIVIDRRRDGDTPVRVRDEHRCCTSILEAYRAAGAMLVAAPGWVDPELIPFCPYLPDLT